MGTPEHPKYSISFQKNMLQNRVLKWAMGPPRPLCALGARPGRAWALGLQYLRGNSLHNFQKKNPLSWKLRSSHGGIFIPLRFEYYVVSRSKLLDKVALRIYKISEKAQGLHILWGARDGPRRSTWAVATQTLL